MSVRLKLILITILIIATVMVSLFVISNTMLLDSYRKIEKESIKQNLQRAEDAIQNDINELRIKILDWANWDDSVKFVSDGNSEFIKSNLNESSITNLELNMFIFVNNKGEVIFSKFIDDKDLNRSDFDSQSLVKNNSIILAKNDLIQRKGILNTSYGPMIIVSHAILSSEGNGPSSGTIIFGKLFGDKEIKKISNVTHLNLYKSQLSSVNADLINKIQKEKYFVRTINDNSIEGYSILNDIYDKPIMLLKIESPRILYSQGVYTINSLMRVSFAFSIISIIVMLISLDKFIFSRFVNLSKQVDDISRTHNLSTKIISVGNDEIGRLGVSINEMLHQLARAQDVEERFMKRLEDEKLMIEKQVEERTTALTKAKDDISKGWLLIQQEKARLTSSINGLPLGFIMTDSHKEILIHNPIISKIFEMNTDQINLANIAEKIGSKFDLIGTIGRAMNEMKLIQMDNLQLESKFIKVSTFPIISGHTDVIGSVILVEDVTEAKVLERSRNEFFSIASHELRTPLTSIKGNTSLIQQYYPEVLKDINLKEMIDDIHESSDRLILIVNDFLDVSRIEQGRIIYKLEKLNLGELAKNVIQDLQANANTKNLKLELASQDNNDLVNADKDRTLQILYNLIGNAIKFTDSGAIAVSITKNNSILELRVTDTGEGISKESIPLLFRKFQQASANPLTRKSSSGTGLGLYISKTLAIGMKGDITLENTVLGKGTTFLLTLPLASNG